MTNAEALIAEIDATPYDEESKALFRWVVNVSDLSRMDERERSIYEERRKYYLDQMALLYAERDEGKAEGMAAGRAEGMAEGRAKENQSIAARLKAQGMASALISQATGLSESEIARL